jgi:hypothetical protein
MDKLHHQIEIWFLFIRKQSDFACVAKNLVGGILIWIKQMEWLPPSMGVSDSRIHMFKEGNGHIHLVRGRIKETLIRTNGNS